MARTVPANSSTRKVLKLASINWQGARAVCVVTRGQSVQALHERLRKQECTLFYGVPGRIGRKRGGAQARRGVLLDLSGAFVSDYICDSFAFLEGRNFFSNTSCTEESEW